MISERTKVRWFWLALLLAALAPPLSLAADLADESTPSVPTTKSSLADKQASVGDRFRDLKALLLRMAELTAATDPRRAELLRQAVSQANERGVDTKLESLVQLLSKESLSQAVKNQGVVQKDLNAILDLLLSEDRTNRLDNEKARIREYIKEVNRLIAAEKALRDAPSKPNARPGDENLEDNAGKQGEVADKTGDLADRVGKDQKPSGAKEKDKDGDKDKDGGKGKDADKQGAPKDVEKGPQEGEAKDKDGGAKDGEGKDADGKPKDGESKEAPPAEQQPNEQKPSDGKAKEGKPSDGKPSDGKPSDGKPSEGKPSEGKPSEGQPSEAQPSDSEQNESAKNESSQSPAQKRLQQAQERMKEAQKNLQDAEQSKSREAQQKAIEELEQAKAELEEILRQLREEEIARMLAMLEERFRKMLAMQQQVYEGTKRIDTILPAQRDRETEIESTRLSRREGEILNEADRCFNLLAEDGTAVAFPEAVSEMRDDMRQIVRRLAEFKVNALTLGLEEDVIAALEDMIAALKKAQKDLKEKEKKPPASNMQGEPQDPPLVDELAELRMIRALQMRVNRSTDRYAQMVKEEQADEPDLIAALRELAEREERIHRVTRDLVSGKNK